MLVAAVLLAAGCGADPAIAPGATTSTEGVVAVNGLDCLTGQWQSASPEAILGEGKASAQAARDDIADLPAGLPEILEETEAIVTWIYVTSDGRREGRITVELLQDGLWHVGSITRCA